MRYGIASLLGASVACTALSLTPAVAMERVSGVEQFSDVRPTDWAYQALHQLVDRYGCVAGFPDGQFLGQRTISRFEAAALLNACLDRVSEITDELRRLIKQFEAELALIQGRVDGLEARLGELDATQFSTTTTLRGQAYFVANANAFKGSAGGLRREANRSLGAANVLFDLELELATSFSGKDLLMTKLRTGSFNANNSLSGVPTSQSALNTWVAIQDVQDFYGAVAPEITVGDNRGGPQTANVNTTGGTCNAFYSPQNGSVNFYRTGGGCNATGLIADIVYHEWGHGFHFNSVQSGQYDSSLGEGAADTVAFTLTDNNIIGPTFRTDGGGITKVDGDFDARAGGVGRRRDE